MKSLDMPPFWTAVAWAVAFGLARILPEPGWDSVGLRWLGLAWIALGFLLAVWAAILFWRRRTPIEPRHTPTALISDGPYRLTRNPIYLAMVVATAGWAIWLGAVWGLLVIPFLWFTLDRRFVREEETLLRANFGEDAEEYLLNTRRWL